MHILCQKHFLYKYCALLFLSGILNYFKYSFVQDLQVTCLTVYSLFFLLLVNKVLVLLFVHINTVRIALLR